MNIKKFFSISIFKKKKKKKFFFIFIFKKKKKKKFYINLFKFLD